MATVAKLASYITGERDGNKETLAVKAVPLEVAEDPHEGSAEHAPSEEPHASVEVVQHAVPPPPPPSKPQELPVDGPASTDPVHDFKKQFGPGYAALDFANELQKRRLAASGTPTTKPQHFDAQVLPGPLDHYKDHVTGGDTGGSAVVEQNIPKSFYPSHPPTGDSVQPWNQQGWPTAGQPSGYVAYPHSSHHVADAAGSDSAPEHATGEDHATHYDHSHEGVVPGSQLPQPSEGTPDAEPVPEAAEPAATSHVMYSDAPENHQGPRYRREAEADADEAFYVRVHHPASEADLDLRGQKLETGPVAECVAKIYCTMAARPTVFGPRSANMTEYLRNVEVVNGNLGMIFFKQASAAGSANEDCEALFEKCTFTAEKLKDIIDGNYPN
ncbi:hypothetical protein MTO96_028539 [Rhipicephalus appendiculatus]